jgi:hypothetical protein
MNNAFTKQLKGKSTRCIFFGIIIMQNTNFLCKLSQSYYENFGKEKITLNNFSLKITMSYRKIIHRGHKIMKFIGRNIQKTSYIRMN